MTQDEAPYSGWDTPNEKAPDFHPGLFAMKMAHQAGFEPTTPFGGQCGTEILVGDKRSKMPLSAVLQGFRLLLCLAV
ncbi:hypothetical protein ACYCFC_18325 [Stutzerimonas sp. NM35]